LQGARLRAFGQDHTRVGGTGQLNQLVAEGGGAEPARPRGAEQRLQPGRVQRIGDAIGHALDPFQVVDRQSRVEVTHPRRGLVTVVVEDKNRQAGGPRSPSELPYPWVRLDPDGKEQGGQPGSVVRGETGSHDHVVAVSGDHDEPALGEHANPATSLIRRERSPSLSTRGSSSRTRSRTRNQVNAGRCNTAAMRRSPRRASASPSCVAGDGSSAGRPLTAQPTTRACSPDQYPLAVIVSASAKPWAVPAV